MNPDKWHQVKGIFNSVLELSPDMRDAYLERACGPDPELRRAVDELICSYGTSFLDNGSLYDASISETKQPHHSKTTKPLNGASASRGVSMFFLRIDPIFDAIRDEPRFQGLMRRIGLVS